MSSGLNLEFAKRQKCFSISIRLSNQSINISFDMSHYDRNDIKDMDPDATGSAGLSDAKSICTDSSVTMYGSLFCLCSLYEDSFMWPTSDVPHAGGAVRRRRQWRLQWWLRHGSPSPWSWREVAPYRSTGKEDGLLRGFWHGDGALGDTEDDEAVSVEQIVDDPVPQVSEAQSSTSPGAECPVREVTSRGRSCGRGPDHLPRMTGALSEHRVDVLTFQVDEMTQVTSPEYIFERQRAGVSMPQSFEEIIELVPQERRQERFEEQICRHASALTVHPSTRHGADCFILGAAGRGSFSPRAHLGATRRHDVAENEEGDAKR